MTLRPMWAKMGGGFGFQPNGRAEGYVAHLSPAARRGSFDGGSVGLVSIYLHTWGLPSRRPPPVYEVRCFQGVPHFHCRERLLSV